MADKYAERFMALALELARQGGGKTSPNPMVGAVIVKNGRIVGRGYHKKAGTPHAEIHALNEAGSKARGGILYVTLEPCCHYGRTKPCADEIIRSGISEVFYSMLDPNPLVSGKGAARFKKAGIKVTSGILRHEAELLNEVYVKYIKTGIPFVILKTAQTLDGRITASGGDSKWITGTKARKMGHQLRAWCDAVAVGGGTARIDNPELTVRLVKGKNPYRIILTHSAKLPKSLKLFGNNNDAKTILATTDRNGNRIKAKNLIVWSIRGKDGKLSLTDFLEKAGQFGITSILIEGGATLATAFLKAGLVDKHYIFMAPKIIGRGIEAVGDLNIKKIGDGIGYNNMSVRTDLTPDILVIGYPKKKMSK
ncbi:MAG: riboflavin biosynthesis protein RibD [candidate division Zixibacteria bacterium HGW-Zixibacteria-1]|nr:MAG: riboflavin biosynthesis protein RibD [candidate division Zixibacteria bacterium HGW-Zixibacteria-1]